MTIMKSTIQMNYLTRKWDNLIWIGWNKMQGGGPTPSSAWLSKINDKLERDNAEIEMRVHWRIKRVKSLLSFHILHYILIITQPQEGITSMDVLAFWLTDWQLDWWLNNDHLTEWLTDDKCKWLMVYLFPSEHKHWFNSSSMLLLSLCVNRLIN